MGQLYTNLKIFHYQDKLDSLARGKSDIKAPIHIRIKPTNICNHDCSYCAYKSSALQLGKDMEERDQIPRDKMLEIIDDIIEMGVKSVTFSGGGEPFVYKHLLETVQALANSPVRFASLTNGAHLKGEIAKVFAHHGTWLRVSMDGWDDESYVHYRKTRSKEYTRILENMEAFKKLGGACRLGVSLIIDQDNKDHIFDAVKRLQNVGVDSVKVSPCIVSNSGANNNDYHRKIFEDVRSQIERIQEFASDSFEIFDAYHELDEKFTKPYDWCPYLQILPIIGADLNVYSCQDKAYNLDSGLLGSIKEQRFKDFWFNDKEKFFQINPAKHCDHHCVSNNKNKLILEYYDAHPEHLGFV